MSSTVENNKINWAFVSSVVLHLLLLLYLFFTTVQRLTPKVEEEGLLVAIGDFTETSIGDEPLGNTEEIISTPENLTPPSNEKPKPSKEDVLTSEVDEAVKTPPAKKDKTTPNKTDVKPTTKPALKETPKPASNSNTQAEDLSKKKQQYGNLFGKGQGTKDGDGNQGDPNGGPDSKILEGISKGKGTVGGGLATRKVVQSPTLSENSQKYGKVSVKVCVDKNGKVVSSTFTQKGSTTTDAELVRLAEKGGMKYVFGPGELDSQCGTITFDFKLN